MLKKGGIETIIGVVILVAIVIGLIIASILPIARTIGNTSNEGTNKLEHIYDGSSTTI